LSSSRVGGWYLRGDIGVGVQSFSEFDFTQTNAAFVWPSSWTIVQQDIQDTTIFGLGIGYEFNNWLRVDVHRRISHQGGIQGDRQLQPSATAASAPASTSTRATIRPRSSWPTPISISAPGGA
jgi:opacity protein-like surface antigen